MKAIIIGTATLLFVTTVIFSKKEIIVNKNETTEKLAFGCNNALEVFNNSSNSQCIIRWVTIIDENGSNNIFTGTWPGNTTWVGCVGQSSNPIIAQILSSFYRAYIVNCFGTRISNIVSYNPGFGNYTFSLSEDGCGIPGGGINTLIVE